MSNVEQADGKSKRSGDYHSFIKKRKRRIERRKAKIDPESAPTYNRLKGFET
jgi:hypothetical protein